MIVIAIIMVITTAGIPMVWKALTKDPLAKAVNDVLEGCKTARDRAILQNRPFDFVIRNREENKAEMNVEASVIKDNSGGAPAPAPAKVTMGEPGSLVGSFPRSLGEDVAIELLAVNFIDHMDTSEARARFYPNGTSDEFTVTFNRRGIRRTITVDIITGRAYELIK